MSTWDVYWFVKLDDLCVFFTACFVVFIVLLVGLSLEWSLSELNGEENVPKILKKRWKVALIGLCIFVPLRIFTPTTKQAAVIYMLPKIVNNEQVQKIPANFVKVLNTKMEEWLGQFEPAKEGESD